MEPVHGPIHSSWFDKIENYCSTVQRKAIEPVASVSLVVFTERPFYSENYDATITYPFEWKYTRVALNAPIARSRDLIWLFDVLP